MVQTPAVTYSGQNVWTLNVCLALFYNKICLIKRKQNILLFLNVLVILYHVKTCLSFKFYEKKNHGSHLFGLQIFILFGFIAGKNSTSWANSLFLHFKKIILSKISH